jgi:hypothetical protein
MTEAAQARSGQTKAATDMARPDDRRERRRKDGEAENAGLRLAIPDSVYERYPRNAFRLAWIRGDTARMHQKHGQDWDPVDGVDPVPGAIDRHGNPVNHILCAKRLEWVMEDRARAEERRKLVEDQAARGRVSGKGDDAGEGLSEKVSYTDGANRLR